MARTVTSEISQTGEEFLPLGTCNLDDDHPDSTSQHPALKVVRVLDCASGNRIIPNSVPSRLENDCFSGEVMLLMRTPDVDKLDDCPSSMGDTSLRLSEYFRGKQRRFEFQFQIKLKKVPTGPLFLGCELERPIKVSRLTKGLSNVLLAMIRRINSGFHYSWGGDPKSRKKHHIKPEILESGKYESTHLSFPVEASMDRIVITKPGERPPQLGYELFETNESVKRRRKTGAGSVNWNLEDTYTMCLWSAYFDWIQWKSLNVPGVRPFSLSAVTGKQPVYLSVYELPAYTPAEYRKKKPCHYRKDLNIFTRLEFSHAVKTPGGMFSKQDDATEHFESDYSEGETESLGSGPELVWKKAGNKLLE